MQAKHGKEKKHALCTMYNQHLASMTFLEGDEGGPSLHPQYPQALAVLNRLTMEDKVQAFHHARSLLQEHLLEFANSVSALEVQ